MKANPPMSREEAGAQKGGVSGTQPFADKNLLREARRAHSQLPDDQFEALAVGSEFPAVRFINPAYHRRRGLTCHYARASRVEPQRL